MSNGISGSSNPWKATFHRAVLQWSMSITVKAQMLILDFDVNWGYRASNWGYRASKMRAKNPTDEELVLRARYTCCGYAKEEQDAWNTRLLGGRPIRAIRACATETRRSGSSATEISEGHWMPSSAREIVIPPADAAAALGLGFLIKAAKLSTTNSR
jgi:hypothetical protein